MNSTSLKLLSLSFLTLLSGIFVQPATSHAGDGPDPLLVYRVIHDDEIARDEARLCGKQVETSNACQGAWRACFEGFVKIQDNMGRVCSQRPKDCTVDVVAYTLLGYMADSLYDAPVQAYASSAEVFNLNSCRTQHPKSEDNLPNPVQTQADAELEARMREEKMRAERGEAPLPPLAPVPAAPGADAATANTENPDNVAAQNAADTNAGGCFLQISHSSATALQVLFAVLLLAVPFMATAKFKESSE